MNNESVGIVIVGVVVVVGFRKLLGINTHRIRILTHMSTCSYSCKTNNHFLVCKGLLVSAVYLCAMA